MSTTAELRTRLLELGFDQVGFATVPADRMDDDPSVHALIDWLHGGHQADMKWLERGFEKRLTPQLVLPGAQSIIMLGVNYRTPGTPDSTSPTPRWAMYSHYLDYHDTIKEALIRAGKLLEETLGLGSDDYRYYVDTGPVLERSWAERAGLGFIGKNAMLISQEFGNWLFLSAIFVRAKLDSTPTLPGTGKNRIGQLCGKCTRCLDACPTSALIAPGVLDSRLCISYQTIENKGAIPRSLRGAIGNRIYGCDVCAEVCPWNRFAQASRNILLNPRPEIAQLTLAEILELTPGRFAEVFRGTAIKRIKLAGLLRNACIVAGNLASEGREHLGRLTLLAQNESALVRAHAVWAIFKIAGPNGATVLLATAHSTEHDQSVLDEYLAATADRTSKAL